MAPRTILYTGKGGVGKTSVAAATARSCAAAGLRTVVLSTDPAHSLSDSLEVELGPDPSPAAPNLFGQEVQAQEEMERHWQGVQGWLGDLLAERGVDRISAEELTVPPGMDELFSLLWIKRHHEEGEFDCVIVDCAPTGETLRLLSFPDVVTWWLERILPSQRKLAPFARTLFDVPLPGDGVFDDVERLARNLVAMNGILRDHEHTSVRLVTSLDRMVVKEAMRTFTYLNLYGYLTDAIVVNRVLPDRGHGGLLRGLARGAAPADGAGALGLRAGADPPGPALRARGGRSRDARPPGRRGVRGGRRRFGAARGDLAGARDRQRPGHPAPAFAAGLEGGPSAEEDRPGGDRQGGRPEADHPPAARAVGLRHERRELQRRAGWRSSSRRMVMQTDPADPGRGAPPPPPAAEPDPEAPPPPPRGSAFDPGGLFVLLDALRRAAPGELDAQMTKLIREFLLTLRSLIDWYLERLDEPRREPEVEDIPIE